MSLFHAVDRAGYDAAIAKHRGKVVLVDFWATWCLPCVEQLPHTLELGQQMADRGLAVVTVSCDEPDGIGPRGRILEHPAGERRHESDQPIRRQPADDGRV